MPLTGDDKSVSQPCMKMLHIAVAIRNTPMLRVCRTPPTHLLHRNELQERMGLLCHCPRLSGGEDRETASELRQNVRG